jgi:hypothetical protein
MIIVCERYALLPNDKKAMIAGELDRSVREIERKVSVSSEISIPLGFAKTVIGYADKGCLLMCHYLGSLSLHFNLARGGRAFRRLLFVNKNPH